MSEIAFGNLAHLLCMGEAIKTTPFYSSNSEIKITQKSISFGPFSHGMPSNYQINLASFNYTDLPSGTFLSHFHVDAMTVSASNYTQYAMYSFPMRYTIAASFSFPLALTDSIVVNGDFSDNSSSLIQSYENYNAEVPEINYGMPASKNEFLLLTFNGTQNFQFSVPQNSLLLTLYYIE